MLLLDYYKKQDFPSLRRSVRSAEPHQLFSIEIRVTLSVFSVSSDLEQRGCMPKKKTFFMRFWSQRLRRAYWLVERAPSTRWVSPGTILVEKSRSVGPSVGFKSQTCVPLHSVLNTLSAFTPRSMWKCLLASRCPPRYCGTYESLIHTVVYDPLKKIKEEKVVLKKNFL